MTQGVHPTQKQILSIRNRRLDRNSAIEAGEWVPTPFRIGNLGYKPLMPLLIVFILSCIVGGLIP